MKRILPVIAFMLFSGLLVQPAFAQINDPVMINVADEAITKGEFLRVYQKNNTKGETLDRQALEEYLELYINFRLKVKEAIVLGMDTIKSFRDELASYRRQLAQPYLIDDKSIESLVKEAHSRKQYDIRASHILIKVDKMASAADTLAAWNKIMELRKRIMKGEDFGKVAMEASDDPSAKDRVSEGRTVRGNHGDLGYFTAFDMVYPFESAAYKGKLGEVSMPVRTDYGYHLIKVTDRLPAMGKVQIAHIMLTFPKKGTVDDSLKVADSANMAYKLLQSGTDFATVVKQFTDDKTTADKGGLLPWFGVNRMLPEFIQAISKLRKNGDFSEPFQTDYGWHILKLNDRKPIPGFEEDKEELKSKVNKNDRVVQSQDAFVLQVKNEYGFREDLNAMRELKTVVTDSIFNANWTAAEASALKKTIFTIGTHNVTQTDFASFLAQNQRKGPKKDIQAYIENQYIDFVDESVIKYADNQLENKYPDFKALMAEYHDGILLFDLTDKKVWTKAVKDTVGLAAFHNEVKNNYMWDQRLEASIYTINDMSVVKQLKKMIKKGYTHEQILAGINKDTLQKVSVEHKKFIRGENAIIDSLDWKPATIGPFTTSAGKNVLTVIHRLVGPEPKLLSEARGLITADYQNYLEKEWIAELRNKYPVKVNREVFNSIFESR